MDQEEVSSLINATKFLKLSTRGRWLETLVLAIIECGFKNDHITSLYKIIEDKIIINLFKIFKEITANDLNRLIRFYIGVQVYEEYKVPVEPGIISAFDSSRNFYLEKSDEELFYVVKENIIYEALKKKFMRDTQKTKNTIGKRILSLDGGGVRGIIQVLILREIEKVSGKKNS